MEAIEWARWGCAVCGRRAYKRENGGFQPDCGAAHCDAGGHFVAWKDGAARPRIPLKFAKAARGVTISPAPSVNVCEECGAALRYEAPYTSTLCPDCADMGVR